MPLNSSLVSCCSAVRCATPSGPRSGALCSSKPCSVVMLASAFATQAPSQLLHTHPRLISTPQSTPPPPELHPCTHTSKFAVFATNSHCSRRRYPMPFNCSLVSCCSLERCATPSALSYGALCSSSSRSVVMPATDFASSSVRHGPPRHR